MAIVKDRYVTYKHSDGLNNNIRFKDFKRDDASEYPMWATDIQPYDEYEDLAQNLKDCPFCGSKPDRIFIIVAKSFINDAAWSNTKCSNRECLCSFKSVDAKIWNTRYGANNE